MYYNLEWDRYKESKDHLAHFGILGQKWGVRRYQNEDGSLTEEGRKRYLKNPETDNGEYLTDEGKKEFFKGSSSSLTDSGRRASANDDELGRSIRAEEFDRKYSEGWLEAYNAAA